MDRGSEEDLGMIVFFTGFILVIPLILSSGFTVGYRIVQFRNPNRNTARAFRRSAGVLYGLLAAWIAAEVLQEQH